MPISTTITASDLGALFSLPSSALDRTTPETMGSARRPPPDRASRTTPTAPPGYGRRAADAWRPRTHADFLDGGAYPEIDVVQLPAGLGWGANAPASDHPDRAWASPPAALDVNFATLQICAARRALRLDRDSPFPPPTRAARAYHHPCVEPPPSTTPSSPISRASFDPKTKARTHARAMARSAARSTRPRARTRTRSSTRTRTRARHFACAMSSRTPSLDSSSNPRPTASLRSFRTPGAIGARARRGVSTGSPLGSATRW